MKKPKTKSFKPGFAIGLEYDHLAIRAVKIQIDGKGGCLVEAMEEATGDFSEETGLIEGLRLVKDKLRKGSKDSLVTCLSGKQVSASQIGFRRLPPEEMESALRLEMRKAVPFEVHGATLDYQVLGDAEPKSENVQVLVVMAGQGLLPRQLKVLEKADLVPTAVDVLPTAVANAMWSYKEGLGGDGPCVAVHIGPLVATIVVDGARSPFFNRYAYFSAEDILGPGAPSVDRERRVLALADELSRSLAFYDKSNAVSGYQEILLLGEYLEAPGLAESLRRATGLQVRIMDLPGKFGRAHEHPKGRFDLAMSLALRGGQG